MQFIEVTQNLSFQLNDSKHIRFFTLIQIKLINYNKFIENISTPSNFSPLSLSFS